MKTLFFTLIILLFGFTVNAQSQSDSEKNSRIIGITPLPMQVDEVNGLAIGIGVDSNFGTNTGYKKINGLNLDVNPLGFLILCFYDSSKASNTGTEAQINGLSLSLAGNLRNTSTNGVNVSLYNYGHTMNGIFVSLAGTDVEELNGIGASFIGNNAVKGKGLFVGGFNRAEDFHGVQIGVVNRINGGFGIQIGLVNISESRSGLQLGLWNKNAKRGMPLINF